MRTAIFFGLIIAAQTAAGNHLTYDPDVFDFLAYLAVALMVMDAVEFLNGLRRR